jgi:Plant transposon protein
LFTRLRPSTEGGADFSAYRLRGGMTVEEADVRGLAAKRLRQVEGDELFDDDGERNILTALIFRKSRSPGGVGRHRSTRGGSSPGRAPNIDRSFDRRVRRLMSDYFCHAPVLSERLFERRFRTPRAVFDKTCETVSITPPFQRCSAATGRPGLYPRQRIVASLRILAYGGSSDSVDEYLRLSYTSALYSLRAFRREVVKVFGTEHLRAPTEADLRRIMAVNAARGFPGCVGSIDCHHWAWEACPMGRKGQYKSKEKKPTVVLEAIADGELWNWHIFFGSPGPLNDINTLDSSATTAGILAGKCPPHVPCTVNGSPSKLPYHLADSINPPWATFLKTITTRPVRSAAVSPWRKRESENLSKGRLACCFRGGGS